MTMHCFFRATTHTDLIIRAKERGIQYKVIHNASILNAAGCCGLQVKTFYYQLFNAVNDIMCRGVLEYYWLLVPNPSGDLKMMEAPIFKK